MRHQRPRRPDACGDFCRRRLRFESLEERLALTTFTVTSLADGPVNLSDFAVTLRDAISAANNNVAAFPGGPVGDSLFTDSIRFQAGLAGTITLTQGELSVRSRMSISGPGAGVVTVANDMFSARIFNVSNSMTSIVLVTIRDLTIKGGAASLGGGIINRESLRVENCIIIGNTATMGGGIYNADTGALTVVGGSIEANFGSGSALYNVGQATLSNSSVRDNFGNETGVVTNASSATLTIENSSIDGNHPNALCGGIHNNGALTVRDTTITNNKSQGGFVGGVYNDAGGTANLLNCTISGNSESAVGGVLNSGTMTLQNCTTSGNTGFSLAGGVSNSGTMRLANCTISGNQGGGTGGVYNDNDANLLTIENCTITQNRGVNIGGLDHESVADATLHNTIVVDNFKGTGSTRSDLFVVFPLNSLSSFNLVGVVTGGGGGVGIVNGSNGNQVGVTNPLLGPLADNGGATQTHALLAGSPGIDHGSNGAVPPDTLDQDEDGVTTTEQIPFDQRGAGFARIMGSTVDIGAFEVQSGAPVLPGDYNRNGVVNAADYVVWRKTLGMSVASPFLGADGDGNKSINPGDYDVWRAHFGESLPAAGTGTSSAANQALAAATSVEAATSAPNEAATSGPTTADEGTEAAISTAKQITSSDLVSFPETRDSLRVRVRHDATTTLGSAATMLNDSGLLAWLSLQRRRELPLAGDIDSSQDSIEHVTQVDCSELDSVDEVFAGLSGTFL